MLLTLSLSLLGQCSTIKELAAVRQVDFSLDGISDPRLAGINLEETRSLRSVGALELVNLTRAVGERELPLQFVLHVTAENPAENSVNARLLGFDWTLFIEDRETLSGSVEPAASLPPGTPVDIPILIELELFEFFDANVRDMFELALNITGKGGAPKRLRLSAVPTIGTSLGPIRYPGRIDVVNREIGSEP